MKRAVIILAACGIVECAHARLLNPLRIVQWETPIADFQPESIGLLLRSMDLNNTKAVPLPRYLEFRRDLVRIKPASGSSWYLIPLGPDNPHREYPD